MNVVAQITSTGVFSTGVNKNKAFLRAIVGGKGVNILVSDKASAVAPSKGYCFVNTLKANDLYPTANGDSGNVYPEFLADGVTAHPKAGSPVYSKGDKLTVKEYFDRRGVEVRELITFAGFPTDEECKLIAAQRVAQFIFA